jgi:hypothetical protein
LIRNDNWNGGDWSVASFGAGISGLPWFGNS